MQLQLYSIVCLALAFSASAAPARPGQDAVARAEFDDSSIYAREAAAHVARAAKTSSAAKAKKTSAGDKAKAAAAAKAKASKGKGSNNAAASNSTAAASSKDSNDLQSSLTLDPSVLAKGFESNGQEVAEAGQVASLTSSNNFINFCATVKVPITNGQQIKTGSCNPAPMGVIAATTNMPSGKFQFPANLDTIKANTPFTIKLGLKHLEAGNFVNAASNYYSAPQQTNSAGDIIGHTHVTIEKIDNLKSTTVTDPNVFAFFKGVNGKAVNGVVTADVTAGLPEGTYRLASINAAANHQPVLVAVAQHGSLDDMVYFTVTADGKDDGSAAAASSNSTAAASTSTAAASKSTAAAKASSTAAAAKKGNNAASKGAAAGKKSSKKASGKKSKIAKAN
ncbi:hypothetical protein BV25DRAFT_1837928 [Artomyces pyxidatus]|uniref:Uncharacterized protein n=1 Tax=Artomyces pyxidatus TaxID=48021 RepID=A0ACB8T303_9AGAM|nr:hypothetical protein BV25DRAFT_1837928 [Artomyces pyxidatus]